MELDMPCSHWSLNTGIASSNGMVAQMGAKFAPSTTRTGDGAGFFGQAQRALQQRFAVETRQAVWAGQGGGSHPRQE